MSVLLLRLAGPMQSWGTQSRFTERDTGREPSKSGIIGLICAALGRDRSADIADLNQLTMGVRIDQEGKIQKDYHTTMNCYQAHGKGLKNNVSNRYYLADACFLTALEGEHKLLSEIHEALLNPHWQIYLGRKSFVPSLPVWIKDGVFENKTIEKIFSEYDCYVFNKKSIVKPEEDKVKLRCVVDAEFGRHDSVRDDKPVSFESREFKPRYAKTYFTEIDSDKVKEVKLCFSPG
ncbi:MAG: type I-E CRISPR-associated protein Cas5/CasD [candidate division Zixibacteria bacterium]|nr:type I-E CRISPR-associated protein Cas5/CasD [candidate division Zixibacteria bacterium]